MSEQGKTLNGAELVWLDQVGTAKDKRLVEEYRLLRGVQRAREIRAQLEAEVAAMKSALGPEEVARILEGKDG